MSVVASLSAAQLHEPIMPLARPPLIVLQPDQTIADAHDFIRSHADAASIHYFYVVDDDQKLVGVVPARRLLAAQPDKTVRQIMVATSSRFLSGRPCWWRANTLRRGACWHFRWSTMRAS